MRAEYIEVEHSYKLEEERKARKLQRANDFATKVLLQESSGDDENDIGKGQDQGNDEKPSESTKEIRRILNSVSEEKYDQRHYKMITELRVRKMLKREKINYPTKEVFEKRKKELKDLFCIFKDVITARPEPVEDTEQQLAESIE